MTDTILNTPLPYWMCGTLVGTSFFFVPVLRHGAGASTASVAAVLGIVGAFEWSAPDPLLWSDRLVVGGSVLAGIAGGCLAATYVSWIRRFIRAADVRISETL